MLPPFPWTPLYKRLEQENRILTKDCSLYDAWHVVFEPNLMTVQQLAESHEWAWKKIYQYKNIFKLLWAARNFQPLALMANLGYRFYAHHLYTLYTCDWSIEHTSTKIMIQNK